MLQKYNISVEYDNKEVGNNLQDHVVIGLIDHRSSEDSYDKNKYGINLMISLVDWLTNKEKSKTEVSSTNGEVNGFFRTEYTK